MYQDGADKLVAAQLEIQQLRQQIEHDSQQIQQKDQQLQDRDQQIEHDSQQIQQKDQRIHELQERTQSTTIFEYVRICYEVLYSRLVPETNRRLMTGKSTVHHGGRPYPLEMREWNNFLGEQQDLFEEIFNAFPPDYRGFPSLIRLETAGGRNKPLATEWYVDQFISVNIEDPVENIFQGLRSLHAHGLPEELRVDGIMEFVRSPLDTSEPQREAAGERPAPTARRDTAKLQPDSFCVVSRPELTEGSREMTFVSEFKTFNVCSEEDARKIFVPRGNFGPTHLQEMQLTVAQRSIVCQAYQYVMQSFTGFGILTTGKVFVFLRVDWNEPGVLYFHVSTPDMDVIQARARDEAEDAANGVQGDENTRVRNTLYLTAVGQYLAFALRAYRRSLLPGQETHRAIYESLPRWPKEP
ncbi:hypothetical protein E4U22_002441 [Claviceps purpurea]|nr:hypothetical protein E4U28_000896 [Claviceps purpurea]KAG6311763.1 hypothetical protein E4U22_002441 [Claviceps purpurea]